MKWRQCEKKKERKTKRKVNTALWHPSRADCVIVKTTNFECDLLFGFASTHALIFGSCVCMTNFTIFLYLLHQNDGNPRANIMLYAVRNPSRSNSLSFCFNLLRTLDRLAHIWRNPRISARFIRFLHVFFRVKLKKFLWSFQSLH